MVLLLQLIQIYMLELRTFKTRGDFANNTTIALIVCGLKTEWGCQLTLIVRDKDKINLFC